MLERQGADRVPDLLPIRYGRMLVSPFTFYRGAAALMAGDLAGTPDSGVTVQLCGDAHLSNFGLFGTPERQLIFDINDFDETHPGPLGVGREAVGGQLRGARPRPGASPAPTGGTWSPPASASTASACGRRPGSGTLEVWYDHLEVGDLLDQIAVELRRGRLRKDEARTLHGDVAKARTRDSVRVATRRVDRVDGDLRIVAEPALIVPIEDLVVPGTEWEQTDVQ